MTKIISISGLLGMIVISCWVQPIFAQTAGADKGKSEAASGMSESRDAVGDLNAEAVKAGEFPGSIKIPGTGDVSLAIGGFIKTVAIFDSDAENMGADFLPALLGTKRPDEGGAFSLDATLTRLHLEGRAPVRKGQVRGYVEADLNNANDGSPWGLSCARPTVPGKPTTARCWPAIPGRP